MTITTFTDIILACDN